MSLSSIPRLTLAQTPTPLEFMENLTRELAGPKIYIKRDDCTGLAQGGNKVRKLEFLMADAREKGADSIITVGATQSNHARQTAAAAAKCGMECHVLLKQEVESPDNDYASSGNLLLSRLLGAHIYEYSKYEDTEAVRQEVFGQLLARGLNPYFIPVGGSTPLGSLGYTVCGLEIAEQMKNINLDAKAIFMATGSAGTQAGLLTGLGLASSRTGVIGINVSRGRQEQEQLVYGLTRKVAILAGLEEGIGEEQVECDGNFVGPGYGLPTPEMIEAVTLVAKCEGILLDPVYTGKAMAGLIERVRGGEFSKSDNIIFLHTGGSPALYAYKNVFADL